MPRLERLIDCGKVWRSVKLEQCIIVCDPAGNDAYLGGAREHHHIAEGNRHNKSVLNEFRFLPSAVTQEELMLGRRILAGTTSLHALLTNRRGGMIQRQLGDAGELRAVGGKQIARWRVLPDAKGRVSRDELSDERAILRDNSVLVQNIVAHIQNPSPHIKIAAAVPTPSDCRDCVILDTVNQLSCPDRVTALAVCGILNSRLINWFAYQFLFARAIRTMHFDSVTSERIPIPESLPQAVLKELAATVEELHAVSRSGPTERTTHDKTAHTRQLAHLERRIDDCVNELYALKHEDVCVIESYSV